MPSSKRYKELERRLGRLRRALLPAKFDATGTYRGAERVHLRVVSFRMLVHAEIESFIEERAFELFDAGWKAWSNDRVPNGVVLALLAYSGVTTTDPPEKLGGDPNSQKSYDDVTVPLHRAQAVWRSRFRENHGVKESNVLALLLPLGVPANALDATLLADLTSFGGLRGAVAHGSSVGVTSYADAKSEYDQAQQLVSGLGAVDQLISDALEMLGKVGAAMRS